MAASARILVVEDEGIVGLDIRQSLEGLGYGDVDLATTGEEALLLAQSRQPDLVLMDIRLGEGMDGIDAAMAMGDYLDSPIIYLTAYTDEPTLERAKLSQPFGYLVKPFDRKELQTTIEMALHKHSMDRHLRERGRWLEATLRSLGKPVVATRPDGRILFMNRLAEALTGWTEADAFDTEVDKVITAESGLPVVAPHPVVDTSAPIPGLRGQIEGMVMVLREAVRLQGQGRIRLRGEEDRSAAQVESLVRMTRTIAHEFNNHLSVILSQAELLAADCQDEPERKERVLEIARACRDSAELTRQLQALDRLSS
jgi:two-component system, cell cycle sensor histidine kinase and response regulator CckA